MITNTSRLPQNPLTSAAPSGEPPSSISHLPDIVLLKIFSLLPFTVDPCLFPRLSSVSRDFRRLLSSLLPTSLHLPLTPSPSLPYSTLYKLIVCCPGLIHTGVLISHFSLDSYNDWSETLDYAGLANLNLSETVPADTNTGNCDCSSSNQPQNLPDTSSYKMRMEPFWREKSMGPTGSHLASGNWSLSRKHGIRLLASEFRDDSLYICDWPGCVHPDENRNFTLFRGVFEDYKKSKVRKKIMDSKWGNIKLDCAYCTCNEMWDLHLAGCLADNFREFYEDGEPLVRAFVCDNGHVSGAWTGKKWAYYTTRMLVMTCWSDLASDMLEHITSLLPLPDHHRFSAVCKNWRLVAKQKCSSPAPQLPWLVLGDECGTKKRKFYSLSEDRHYAIDIPELYGRYICGSSHGWLVAIDIKITGILINPFTREFYELPPFPPYYSSFHIEKVPGDYEEIMQVLLVQKVILSHDPRETSDFTVMILVGDKRRPAFWKPGNSSWYSLSVKTPGYLSMPRGRLGQMMNDVIYFKEDFIFLSAKNDLYFLKFQPHPKLYKTDDNLWVSYALRINTIEDAVVQSYLVNYLGDLLLVERFDRAIEGQRHYKHYKTYQFKMTFLKGKVFELDQCFDVGEHALFLGANDSILIDPSKVVGGCKCKTNSIYFTDVHRKLSSYVPHFGWDDMGIFNMRDQTFDTFYYPEILHSYVDKPVWFIPNP